MGKVTGHFYNLSTKERFDRQLGYTVYQSDSNIESLKGKLVFALIGGSTGFESFYIDDAIEDFFEDNESWCACMGTKGRWLRLIIRNKDMRKALRRYRK